MLFNTHTIPRCILSIQYTYNTCKRKRGLRWAFFSAPILRRRYTILYLSHSGRLFRLLCWNETTVVEWCASYVLKNQIIASTSHSQSKWEQKKETRTHRNFLDVSDRRQPPFNYGYLKRFVVHFSFGCCIVLFVKQKKISFYSPSSDSRFQKF